MSTPQDPNGQEPDPYQGDYQQYPYQQAGQPGVEQWSRSGLPAGSADPYANQPGQHAEHGQYYQNPYAVQGQYPQYGAPGQPGPYGFQPPGPPPNKPDRTGLFVVLGIVAAIVVVAIVAASIYLINRDSGDQPTAAPATTATDGISAPSTAPGANGCGRPGTGLASAVTDRVASGPLSFPVSAAPGWRPESYAIYAESIAPAGLEKAMDDGQPWQSGAEVGQTNFDEKVELGDAATRMISCIAAGAGYNRAQPRVEGQSAPESVTVDGVAAAKVTAKVLVTSAGVTVPGDDVTLLVIDSAPQTYALIVIPIGRADMAAAGQAVLDQLKVAKDV